MNNTYDVIIICGGADGLSATLVLSRARRSVAVIDAGQPRNAPAAHMHGYLSPDGLPPAELLAIGRAEIPAYGADHVSGVVTDIYRTDGGFRVDLTNAAPLTARRVLVTTGLRDEIPDIPGARDRWGVDLLHCPHCHGYEVERLGVGGVLTSSDEGLFGQSCEQSPRPTCRPAAVASLLRPKPRVAGRSWPGPRITARNQQVLSAERTPSR